jgi:hypothetical protein
MLVKPCSKAICPRFWNTSVLVYDSASGTDSRQKINLSLSMKIVYVAAVVQTTVLILPPNQITLGNEEQTAASNY